MTGPPKGRENDDDRYDRAAERDDVAGRRDGTAEGRDDHAEQRDQRADRNDRRSLVNEEPIWARLHAMEEDEGTKAPLTAAEHAADLRYLLDIAEAARSGGRADRFSAAQDRRNAAGNREEAAQDRQDSHADRDQRLVQDQEAGDE